MRSPRNTEPQANGALARALRRRNPDWTDATVHAERTQVIVETDFAPAYTIDLNAAGRLGAMLQGAGGDVEGVLSVVLPEGLRTGDLESVEGAAFRYATHYQDAKDDSVRWPRGSRWLEGGVDDLTDAIEHLSLSERRLARGTEALE